MSENYDVIVIFPIFGQFGAIRKLDSERIVCKTYIFINGDLYFSLASAKLREPGY